MLEASEVTAGLLFSYQEACRQHCSPPRLFRAFAEGSMGGGGGSEGGCFPAGHAC